MVLKSHTLELNFFCKFDEPVEKKIPTGKLFELRKFDLIMTNKGIGFVKGKRSSGYFVISDIHGKPIHSSVRVKTDVLRISARSTTLTTTEKLDSSTSLPVN